MSYCRFAWDGSDVYVFESSQGIECCGCRLGETFVTSMPEEMIQHLAQHRRAGHYVPDYAVEGLWSNIPGALRPAKPEPPTLTRATLLLDKARLDIRIRQAEEEVQKEEQLERKSQK